jgi:hypothetical protein
VARECVHVFQDPMHALNAERTLQGFTIAGRSAAQPPRRAPLHPLFCPSWLLPQLSSAA